MRSLVPLSSLRFGALFTLAVTAATAACGTRSDGGDGNPAQEPLPASTAPAAGDPASPTGDASPSAPDGGVTDAAPTCAAPPPPAPATPAADVVVTVQADRGPNGAAKPVAVDRRLYSMNVADWQPNDYVPTPAPTYRTYLAALKPGVLRWPAGHRSQEYIWTRGGEGQHGNWTLEPAHVDAFIALSKDVGADAMIAINLKRGTPAAAADLLKYLNVDKKYGVKYLQLGNEPDLTDGIIPSPEAYAAKLTQFVDALKAIDPNVRIVGPELLTGAHVGGIHGTRDWMTPILQAVGGRIDGVSWHYYPLDSGQSNPSSSAIVSVPHLFQETAADWPPAGMGFADTVMPMLATLNAAHAPNAKVWITEIAEDPGPLAGQGISEIVAGALWTADVLGRYAAYGPGAVFRWLFAGSAEHAYGILDSARQPRPAYGAYWMYARHFGSKIVDTKTTKLTEVAAHAALRDDGALTVMLVNKTTTPKRVRVDAKAFAPCTGGSLTFSGTDHYATTFTIDGQPLTTANVMTGLAPAAIAAGDMFAFDVPPTSIRLVVYRP